MTVSHHVLAIVEQFWHKIPGGTAEATENTLAALADLNEFQISGVAARHSPPQDGEVPKWQRMPAGSNLRFHWLPRPVLYEAWLRLGHPTLAPYCRPETVVWASSLIVPPTSAPTVATVHDLDFLRHPQFLSRRGRRFFPLVWAKARERAQLFVCPSQVVANDCMSRGVPAERVTVVPWGVRAPRCSADQASEISAELGLPDRFVLWVGALEPRKNPKGAALAMGRVDCDLVIVGPPTSHPDSGSAFASLGTRVHRLPWVNDRTLSALYRQADVLLYPSFAEGFGLPVLEAMIHGTPVVTSKGTATEEVAGGAALIVDPSDPDEMADAVTAALSDNATRDRLVEDGLIRAGQMTWEATAKGYAEAFRSVR